MLVLDGSEDISATALRVLEPLKKSNISILYVRPDTDLLSKKGYMHQRVIFNVLQEYARSAVFKRIILADVVTMEEYMGEVSLTDYESRLIEMITSVLHMINVYDHIEAVTDTFSEPIDTARLCTFGMIDIKTGEKKEFFPLDRTREIRYYYAINNEALKSDGKLFKKIKSQVKDHEEDIRTSYGVFSTTYDKNYGYFLAHSSTIQKG